ncbi:MAG: GNAT family N-acetyltransferase [Acidimicrobiales bacterium]
MTDDHLDALDEVAVAAAWRERLTTGLSDRAPVGVTAQSLVAELDGVVVAMAAVGPDRDDLGDLATGELWMLNADPSAWGTGAAVALHELACGELAARGHTDAVLWVVEQNDRARRFYEREGWHDDGLAKTEAIGGVDVTELRYRRRLEARGAGSP